MKACLPDDPVHRPSPTDVMVFLAGGITDAPDWQPLLIDKIRTRFADPDDLVIFNPRRLAFDIRQEGIAKEQITWEREHLRKAHIIMFWFPCETLCPITLFEYGYWLSTFEKTRAPRLIIGCHPDYKRKLDLEVQTSLAAPHLTVCNSWDALVDDLLQEYAFVRDVLASQE